jgi:hypothetical protein
MADHRRGGTGGPVRDLGLVAPPPATVDGQGQAPCVLCGLQPAHGSLDAAVMTAHTCHAPGCRLAVPPKLFACKGHWYALPKPMRDAIWATYRPGQEIDKLPSPEYLTAAGAAAVYLAEKYGSQS